MQVPTVCRNCGAIASPAYTCSMCGSNVCAACFDVQTGTCDICAIKFGRRNIRPGIKAKKH
jgi:hypothetical protein